MSTRTVSNPRKTGPFPVLLFLIFPFLLVSCSVTSYTVAGFTSTRAGRYTRNTELLAGVSRVALVAFHGENHAGPEGSAIARVVDAIYQQALSEIDKVQGVEIVPPETVAADPVYRSVALDGLPENQYSPVPGLTDLPQDLDAAQVAELCESLEVDALLFLRFELDWEFPSWNIANIRTMHQYILLLPAGKEIVWETRSGTWMEALVPLPSDFTRMFETTFTAEEWEIIMNASAETPLVLSEGGAPVYFLADDIRAAQEGG
jgi:hypothetical protein